MLNLNLKSKKKKKKETLLNLVIDNELSFKQHVDALDFLLNSMLTHYVEKQTLKPTG